MKSDMRNVLRDLFMANGMIADFIYGVAMQNLPADDVEDMLEEVQNAREEIVCERRA
jgi:hypothetical protein